MVDLSVKGKSHLCLSARIFILAQMCLCEAQKVVRPSQVGTFSQALRADERERNARRAKLSWRHFVPAFVLLAAVLGLQVWLTDLPYTPYAGTPALIRVAGRHPCPARLALEVNGEVILDQVCESSRPAVVFEPVEVSSGEHHLRLTLTNGGLETNQVLFDETVRLDERQVFDLAIGD